MRYGVAIVAGTLILSGCGWLKSKDAATGSGTKTTAQRLADRQRLQRTCASAVTYDRLKVVAFEKAAQIHGGRSGILNEIEAASIVRMENPVVKSRDETLNITVCGGRFVLELPPGAERAFNGERRLRADIEYSAQQAVDDSGPVYQMQGAEPIVYRLATLGARQQTAAVAPPPTPPPTLQPPPPLPPPPALKPARPPSPQPARPPVSTPRAMPTPRPVSVPHRQELQVAAPRRAADPRPVVASPPRDVPRDEQRARFARTSFDCRKVTGRVTTMICSNDRLAAADRAMSATYFRELAAAGPATRTALRNSVDRFIAFRNRCSTEACVSQTYSDRIDEIRDITSGR